MSVREENPEIFMPDLENTFPSLGKVFDDIKNEPFRLYNDNIKSRGKALRISRRDVFGVNVHLGIHSQYL